MSQLVNVQNLLTQLLELKGKLQELSLGQNDCLDKLLDAENRKFNQLNNVLKIIESSQYHYKEKLLQILDPKKYCQTEMVVEYSSYSVHINLMDKSIGPSGEVESLPVERTKKLMNETNSNESKSQLRLQSTIDDSRFERCIENLKIIYSKLFESIESQEHFLSNKWTQILDSKSQEQKIDEAILSTELDKTMMSYNGKMVDIHHWYPQTEESSMQTDNDDILVASINEKFDLEDSLNNLTVEYSSDVVEKIQAAYGYGFDEIPSTKSVRDFPQDDGSLEASFNFLKSDSEILDEMFEENVNLSKIPQVNCDGELNKDNLEKFNEMTGKETVLVKSQSRAFQSTLEHYSSHIQEDGVKSDNTCNDEMEIEEENHDSRTSICEIINEDKFGANKTIPEVVDAEEEFKQTKIGRDDTKNYETQLDVNYHESKEEDFKQTKKGGDDTKNYETRLDVNYHESKEEDFKQTKKGGDDTKNYETRMDVNYNESKEEDFKQTDISRDDTNNYEIRLDVNYNESKEEDFKQTKNGGDDTKNYETRLDVNYESKEEDFKQTKKCGDDTNNYETQLDVNYNESKEEDFKQTKKCGDDIKNYETQLDVNYNELKEVELDSSTHITKAYFTVNPLENKTEILLGEDIQEKTVETRVLLCNMDNVINKEEEDSGKVVNQHKIELDDDNELKQDAKQLAAIIKQNLAEEEEENNNDVKVKSSPQSSSAVATTDDNNDDDDEFNAEHGVNISYKSEIDNNLAFTIDQDLSQIHSEYHSYNLTDNSDLNLLMPMKDLGGGGDKLHRNHDNSPTEKSSRIDNSQEMISRKFSNKLQDSEEYIDKGVYRMFSRENIDTTEDDAQATEDHQVDFPTSKLTSITSERCTDTLSDKWKLSGETSISILFQRNTVSDDEKDLRSEAESQMLNNIIAEEMSKSMDDFTSEIFSDFKEIDENSNLSLQCLEIDNDKDMNQTRIRLLQHDGLDNRKSPVIQTMKVTDGKEVTHYRIHKAIDRETNDISPTRTDSPPETSDNVKFRVIKYPKKDNYNREDDSNRINCSRRNKSPLSSSNQELSDQMEISGQESTESNEKSNEKSKDQRKSLPSYEWDQDLSINRTELSEDQVYSTNIDKSKQEEIQSSYSDLLIKEEAKEKGFPDKLINNTMINIIEEMIKTDLLTENKNTASTLEYDRSSEDVNLDKSLIEVTEHGAEFNKMLPRVTTLSVDEYSESDDMKLVKAKFICKNEEEEEEEEEVGGKIVDEMSSSAYKDIQDERKVGNSISDEDDSIKLENELDLSGKFTKQMKKLVQLKDSTSEQMSYKSNEIQNSEEDEGADEEQEEEEWEKKLPSESRLFKRDKDEISEFQEAFGSALSSTLESTERSRDNSFVSFNKFNERKPQFAGDFPNFLSEEDKTYSSDNFLDNHHKWVVNESNRAMSDQGLDSAPNVTNSGTHASEGFCNEYALKKSRGPQSHSGTKYLNDILIYGDDEEEETDKIDPLSSLKPDQSESSSKPDQSDSSSKPDPPDFMELKPTADEASNVVDYTDENPFNKGVIEVANEYEIAQKTETNSSSGNCNVISVSTIVGFVDFGEIDSNPSEKIQFQDSSNKSKLMLGDRSSTTRSSSDESRQHEKSPEVKIFHTNTMKSNTLNTTVVSTLNSADPALKDKPKSNITSEISKTYLLNTSVTNIHTSPHLSPTGPESSGYLAVQLKSPETDDTLSQHSFDDFVSPNAINDTKSSSSGLRFRRNDQFSQLKQQKQHQLFQHQAFSNDPTGLSPAGETLIFTERKPPTPTPTHQKTTSNLPSINPTQAATQAVKSSTASSETVKFTYTAPQFTTPNIPSKRRVKSMEYSQPPVYNPFKKLLFYGFLLALLFMYLSICYLPFYGDCTNSIILFIRRTSPFKFQQERPY